MADNQRTKFRIPTEAELAEAERIAEQRSKEVTPMPVPVFDPPPTLTTPWRAQDPSRFGPLRFQFRGRHYWWVTWGRLLLVWRPL